MSAEVVAEVEQGLLRGKRVESAAGGEYFSFQGIPYARPPLGPLRFRPPQPAGPWEGIKDATRQRATAPCLALGHCLGDEDCLFLNVYTPQWPAKELRPVMVWVHGGGFVMGSGNTDFYGPDFLVAEDVVLVTFNYRLGALGFLHLEGSDATANNGLRDQVLALAWVRDNIASFGGDASRVTVFGESAGAVSVHGLMLAPSAAGLFHRAIAMSGVAMLPVCFASHDVSKRRSLRLAELLGCASRDPQEIADRLRTVPHRELVEHQYHALSDQEKKRLLSFSFTPTEEINSSDPFFPDHPLKLLEQGKFAKVPFITGVTSAEGRIAFHGADMHPLTMSEISENLELVLPWDLAPELGTERSKEIADKLRQFYFGDRSVSEDSVEQFVQMASDLIFVYPMYTAIRLHLKNSDSPLYVYVFDHEIPWDLMLLKDVTRPSVPGASHGEDFSYLFFTSAKPNIYHQDSAEAKVLNHMVKYWTHFAKTGDVSQVANKVPWAPVTKDKFQYLKIRKNLKLEAGLFKERMEFLDDWYSTFKKIT
ncbi:acetylcholinesterase-like [Bacillus rossius redtenbacheri]|uniref:acetylcholinesterase-like n=1 Tax=Bacillus rossius redtenbacheri TaxID=93214 RepID=UPI002FDD038D